jgi:hypothetical protein
MLPRGLTFLMLAWVLLLHAAEPKFTVPSTGVLVFAASDLMTNGAGSGRTSRVALSGISAISERGGRLSVVNTQRWIRTYGYSYVASIATAPQGRVSVLAGQGDITTIGLSADGTSRWTNRYDAPGRIDVAADLKMDFNGNTFVVGESAIGSSLKSVVTLKYASGGAPLWTNIYNETGTNYHQTVGIVTDSSGDAAIGIATFHNGPGYFTTVKYKDSGQPLWTNRHRADDFSSDWIATIAVDASNNIIVTGGGFLTFKYSSGGAAIWTNQLTGNAPSIATDRQGNVFVAGDTFRLGHHYATVKFSPNGTPIWTNYITAPQYQGGYVPQVFTDPEGNVYVIGGTPGSSLENTDLTIRKLSSDGVVLWTNRFYEGGYGITPSAVGVDVAGNLTFSVRSVIGGTNSDFLTLKYRTDGNLMASNRFDGSFNARPDCLAIDEFGDTYIAGPSGSGIAVVKYVDYVRYTPPENFYGIDTFSTVWTDDSGETVTNNCNSEGSPNVAAVHSYLVSFAINF